ncbi:MAG: hypothetical protein SOZ32_06150 [Bacilli bacterium]|nr:hypothetical protein [Mollicutes bacterium]MDY3899762.1 hypothetical protein [Bacilli bacterium]
MEKVKFQQTLTPEDLIAYNCYLATKRSKSSLMTRILGLFLIIMGIVDFFRPKPQIAMCIIIIIFGVFGLFFLNPLLLIIQKNTIRKKIAQNYSDVLMNVTVSEEGYSFEVPTDEVEKEKEEENYYGEIHTVKPIEEVISNEEAREQEYEVAHPVSDDITEELHEETEEQAEIETAQEEQKPQNVFSIPWNGITKIVDDGTYMFINMVGYQAMIIKKSAYEQIEEIVKYSKEKLGDPKRYKVILPKTNKKENDHE